MADPPKPDAALSERLARLEAALAPAAPAPIAKRGHRGRSRRQRGQRAATLGIALLVVAAATGTWALVGPAALLLVIGGLMRIDSLGELLLHSLPAGTVAPDPEHARIGMGASIASDAIVEPGATVEMGASVGSGAIVRRGAVVRMGSSIGAGAIVEADAVVSWGVSVRKGAVIGAGASVGSGCDVRAGARVPAGMRLMPGTDWSGGSSSLPAPSSSASAPLPAPATPIDPRRARVEAACEKINGQLASAPESFREMLGDPAKTVRTLRQTCLALLEREAALRRESGPEQMQSLEAEKAALVARLQANPDPVVQRSLTGAVAAIDDQIGQRKVLARNADRLDAELTRLVLTLEGMGAQLVRMHSAGADAAAADGAGVGASLQSLHDEVEALVGALEEMAQPAAGPAGGMTPVVDVGDTLPSPRNRERA